jgi:hypothetical protein
MPRPSKWGPARIRQLKSVEATLNATGKTFDDLRSSISSVKLGADCAPWDLSLERLASKDCERLDALLSGKNSDTAKLKAAGDRDKKLRRAKEMLAEGFRDEEISNMLGIDPYSGRPTR